MTDVRAGVIGVGSMGHHHARVYSELLGVDLVGVHDADPEQAVSVATEYDAEPLGIEQLLERVDAVSVAVPTEYHYKIARDCIVAGVDLLIEKPFVDDLSNGRELVALADDNDVRIQVGHIERFNPAVQSLAEILEDKEPLTISAERLGPPLERDVADSVIKDLMIHDVDILLSLVDQDVTNVNAVTTCDGEYSTASVRFDGGCVGRLTASRITHEKVRRLSVGTDECHIKVDYIDQSVRIYRRSSPSFVGQDGNVRYHHEGVVEKVAVDSTEPLKNELESFVEAVRGEHSPEIAGEDALRVLETVARVESAAADTDAVANEVVQ